MNGNQCLPGGKEKTFFFKVMVCLENVEYVVCGKLAKTCRNTVYSSLVCVKKKFDAGFV